MRKGTILLIDDSPSELLLCKTALEQTEIDNPVVTFRDAEEAYEYIAHDGQNVFVIVCDIKMPPLSGLELLEKINADYKLKLKAIPFIFLSNSNAAKDVEQAYALGAQGYYVKPMLLDELSEIFKGIVNYWRMAQIPQSE